jgi:CDP-diacylglycerol---glycerol-3-phosphate 3-phosphatidyltransferase
MISVYQIKPKFQQLLRPLMRAMRQAGLTPNHITWMAIVLSAGCGVFIYLHPGQSALWLVPVVLFVRMALNALDGMMAREYQLQSRAGEVLNELGDVVSDLALYAPLLWVFGADAIMFSVFLFLSVINEMAGLLGKAVSGTRRYEGPMGKSDRALLVGLWCFVLLFWPEGKAYSTYVFIGASALLLLSTFVRIRKTIQTP